MLWKLYDLVVNVVTTDEKLYGYLWCWDCNAVLTYDGKKTDPTELRDTVQKMAETLLAVRALVRYID